MTSPRRVPADLRKRGGFRGADESTASLILGQFFVGGFFLFIVAFFLALGAAEEYDGVTSFIGASIMAVVLSVVSRTDSAMMWTSCAANQRTTSCIRPIRFGTKTENCSTGSFSRSRAVLNDMAPACTPGTPVRQPKTSHPALQGVIVTRR